mmetsp:Transcript_30260/g.56525  ORF Transcript_30260/g.56525 Transcript_30260/m.56525 type:complete len:223 (+) Transcript_30260:338-1006(+)
MATSATGRSSATPKVERKRWSAVFERQSIVAKRNGEDALAACFSARAVMTDLALASSSSEDWAERKATAQTVEPLEHRASNSSWVLMACTFLRASAAFLRAASRSTCFFFSAAAMDSGVTTSTPAVLTSHAPILGMFSSPSYVARVSPLRRAMTGGSLPSNGSVALFTTANSTSPWNSVERARQRSGTVLLSVSSKARGVALVSLASSSHCCPWGCFLIFFT